MTNQYRTLVSQYRDQVYSLARYLLADASEAEDVTQESFIKLWQKPDSLDANSVGPWLLKVARNACLDRLRKRKPQVDIEAEVLMMSENDEPAARLEQQQENGRLMKAIGRLDEPSRSLVILRDIHEHSYESVGEILDLKPSQVKVYLHRARARLSELFTRQECEQPGVNDKSER